MKKKYRRLWVQLREQLTHKENEEQDYSTAQKVLHEILTTMAEMEADEFLEEIR